MLSEFSEFLEAYNKASDSQKNYIDSEMIGDEAENLVRLYDIEKQKQRFIVSGIGDAFLKLRNTEKIADHLCEICQIENKHIPEFKRHFSSIVGEAILSHP